jgi:hypothetical protein
MSERRSRKAIPIRGLYSMRVKNYKHDREGHMVPAPLASAS